jgi:hypothetical protein
LLSRHLIHGFFTHWAGSVDWLIILLHWFRQLITTGQSLQVFRWGGGLILVVILSSFIKGIESLDGGTRRVYGEIWTSSLVVGVQLYGRSGNFPLFFMLGWFMLDLFMNRGLSDWWLLKFLMVWLESFIGIGGLVPSVVLTDEGRGLVNVVVTVGLGTIEIEILLRGVVVVGFDIGWCLLVNIGRGLRKESIALCEVIPGIVGIDLSWGLWNGPELLGWLIVVIKFIWSSCWSNNWAGLIERFILNFLPRSSVSNGRLRGFWGNVSFLTLNLSWALRLLDWFTMSVSLIWLLLYFIFFLWKSWNVRHLVVVLDDTLRNIATIRHILKNIINNSCFLSNNLSALIILLNLFTMSVNWTWFNWLRFFVWLFIFNLWKNWNIGDLVVVLDYSLWNIITIRHVFKNIINNSGFLSNNLGGLIILFLLFSMSVDWTWLLFIFNFWENWFIGNLVVVLENTCWNVTAVWHFIELFIDIIINSCFLSSSDMLLLFRIEILVMATLRDFFAREFRPRRLLLLFRWGSAVKHKQFRWFFIMYFVISGFTHVSVRRRRNHVRRWFVIIYISDHVVESGDFNVGASRFIWNFVAIRHFIISVNDWLRDSSGGVSHNETLRPLVKSIVSVHVGRRLFQVLEWLRRLMEEV